MIALVGIVSAAILIDSQSASVPSLVGAAFLLITAFAFEWIYRNR